MNLKQALTLWESVRTLRLALAEQQEVVRDVHARAAALVLSPAGAPPEFSVSLDPLPEPLLTLRRNLFSTLFQSTYLLLKIAPARRLIYGKLNYLFRIWVTSADNLLDQEDKVTLPVRMPGQARVMRQVVSIMAADRVLDRLLTDAVREGELEAREAALLSEHSLRVLLPSAAQEASEEGGITERPPPEYVLNTIHRLKTGLLFHLPFLGPETIEGGIDQNRLAAMKNALLSFGLGCQILDDIRDMAQDHREKRHNYILSCLQWNGDPFARRMDEQQPEIGARIYGEIPHVTHPAARLAMSNLCAGISGMSREGLDMQHPAIESLAGSLFDMLDLEDLRYAL